jgi:hypothetical protein
VQLIALEVAEAANRDGYDTTDPCTRAAVRTATYAVRVVER